MADIYKEYTKYRFITELVSSIISDIWCKAIQFTQRPLCPVVWYAWIQPDSVTLIEIFPLNNCTLSRVNVLYVFSMLGNTDKIALQYQKYSLHRYISFSMIIIFLLFIWNKFPISMKIIPHNCTENYSTPKLSFPSQGETSIISIEK